MAETRAARFSPKITFSAIEALYWMSMSMAPFQVLFLQSRGLDSVATGQVMAVISLIGVVMPSLWGFASDRLRSIKRVMIFCILTTALLRLLIPVMSWSPLGNSTLEVGLLLVMTLFQVGMTPLLDAWLVSLIQRHGNLDYSSIRMWGSLGYSAVVALMTPLIGWFSVDVVFVVCVVLAMPFLMLCTRQEDVKPLTPQEDQPKANPMLLLKSFPFVSFLIFSTLIYMPTTVVTTYAAYMFEAIGENTNLVGLLIGLRTVMEAPGMLLHSRMRKKYRVSAIMLLAAALYVVEMALYQFAGSVAHLILLGMVDGLCYGLLLPGIVCYAPTLAPESLRSTAQALCNVVCNSLAGVLLGLVGGWMIAAFGARTLYVSVSAVALLGGLLFFISLFVQKRSTGLE